LNARLKETQEKYKNQLELTKELKQHIETLPVPEEYERLKRKLHLIQAVQFNALDVDTAEGDTELFSVRS
jgi:hypothetical protein